MKLPELDLATIRRAVSIYLDLAYGGGSSHARRLPDLDLEPDADEQALLGLFQEEACLAESDAGSERRVRYTMRLGNRNYPFMKLVLQEHLVRGEYFFAVDTHDEMDIKPDFPDYEAWMAVRRFNRKLKNEIEAQLAAEGVATAASLKNLVSARSPSTAPTPASRRILVVDDEEDLADCVEALLAARGFAVEKVHDGRTGVDRARAAPPDLIVLDYELPEMDGLEVIEALRAEPTTRGVPVLLTTASRISVEDIGKAEGFLAKPYHEELLYAMVQRLLPQPDHQARP